MLFVMANSVCPDLYYYHVGFMCFFMYVLYVTQFCLCPGSKNPDITLKIAEIRTDNLGKVSACSVPQNFLFYHRDSQRDVQTSTWFFSIRLSAHRTRSCLFLSAAYFLRPNISPEPVGPKTADCKYFLSTLEKSYDFKITF